MTARELTLSSEAQAEEGLLTHASEIDDEAKPGVGCPGADCTGARYGAAAAAEVPRRRVKHVAWGVGGTAALVVLALVGSSHCPWHLKANTASPDAVKESTVGLSFFGSMTSIAGTLGDGVKAMDDIVTQVNDSYHNFSDMIDSMSDTAESLANTSSSLVDKMYRPSKWRKAIRKKLQAMNATEKAEFKAKLKKKLNITSWKNLRPQFNLTDGNPCPDDEEVHGGLCYSKCSTLTQGKFPNRESAWTCCKDKPPCGSPGSGDTQMDVCAGYDTSSYAVDSCPHPVGSCLLNEELFNGYCYKKCALITFGVLPHRRGPSSCCNVKATFAFLDAEGCDTNSWDYSVGGGKGYHALQPCEVHQPLPLLTESES